jgi:hypothetical protein
VVTTTVKLVEIEAARPDIVKTAALRPLLLMHRNEPGTLLMAEARG